MSTYFTIWHYLAIMLGLILFLLTVFLAFREQRPSIRNSIIISSFLVNVVIGFIVVMAIDKYTKQVEIYNLDNHRLLLTEQIVFTGVVKNVGDYAIDTVKLEIKLVNKGHMIGNRKSGDYFKPSGFAEFFGGINRNYQPQTLIETPIIARNLQPGESRAFRVAFTYPPYFRGVTLYTRVFAH